MLQEVEGRIRSAISTLEIRGCTFVAADSISWIDTVEHRFGLSLPPVFRFLLTHFMFEEFDIGGVTIFANLGDGSPMDITAAPFADRYMSPWLISRGFVQIGRPDTGSYDPVCLAVCGSTTDPEIVRFDHEDILQERTKVTVERLAASFLELLERPNA
jgi:hypothetical protein